MATKKKEAKKTEGRRGRPHSLAGKKLFKIDPKDHGLREGARRLDTYKSISQGMKFEKFVETGGNVGDLVILVNTKKVRAE